uniref:TIP41-like protein n=1 Tax=Nannospalax galili TaxID=1026970 RepID=A0A8C6W4X3_NANGA
MMTHSFQRSHQDFSFRPWKLTAAKTHVLRSADVEKLAAELHMPSFPEMMFGDVLRIQHGSGFGIECSATDALRCVNNYEGMLQVACAEEWQESRTEGEHSKQVIKPSRCEGTVLGDSLKLKVVPATDHVDTEKLKARRQIKFFEEVLFEDEPHGHGVSTLSVKIRVMPSSFFLLLQFLRIDGVLIRMNDTSLYHEADKTYIKIANLMHIPLSLFTEPNEIPQYLPIKEAVCKKLVFPERIDPNPADSQESTPAE